MSASCHLLPDRVDTTSSHFKAHDLLGEPQGPTPPSTFPGKITVSTYLPSPLWRGSLHLRAPQNTWPSILKWSNLGWFGSTLSWESPLFVPISSPSFPTFSGDGLIIFAHLLEYLIFISPSEKYHLAGLLQSRFLVRSFWKHRGFSKITRRQ